MAAAGRRLGARVVVELGGSCRRVRERRRAAVRAIVPIALRVSSACEIPDPAVMRLSWPGRSTARCPGCLCAAPRCDQPRHRLQPICGCGPISIGLRSSVRAARSGRKHQGPTIRRAARGSARRTVRPPGRAASRAGYDSRTGADARPGGHSRTSADGMRSLMRQAVYPSTVFSSRTRASSGSRPAARRARR
jgi:hypothetical protein